MEPLSVERNGFVFSNGVVVEALADDAKASLLRDYLVALGLDRSRSLKSLDAEILADVYRAMTGGQTALQLSDSGTDNDGQTLSEQIVRLAATRARLPVIKATAQEIVAHETQLQEIAAASGGKVVWRGNVAQSPAESQS